MPSRSPCRSIAIARRRSSPPADRWDGREPGGGGGYRERGPNTGGARFTLEPWLAAGMLGGLTYLEHYPYECTEQTVSRFLPNVVTLPRAEGAGAGAARARTRLPELVGVGVQRLYAKQHFDGGWGWWRHWTKVAFISAYALLGLIEADRAGFAVDQDALVSGQPASCAKACLASGGLRRAVAGQPAGVHPLRVGRGGPGEPNRAGALFEAARG